MIKLINLNIKVLSSANSSLAPGSTKIAPGHLISVMISYSSNDHSNASANSLNTNINSPSFS